MKLNISGDGAKVSRVSNFVTLSIAFPDTQKCLSANNTKTLAIMKCEEKYEDLKVCAWPIVQEIYDLLRCNSIENDGEKYLLDIYFGGDMKFIAIFLGLMVPQPIIRVLGVLFIKTTEPI